MKRFSYHQTNHIWIESCYARRFVHTSYNSYPHPTHEMGWGRGRDGDVMYMNACYCYILVRVFYYCLFITVLHSSSWWVCKLSPHCFSSYTWSIPYSDTPTKPLPLTASRPEDIFFFFFIKLGKNKNDHV